MFLISSSSKIEYNVVDNNLVFKSVINMIISINKKKHG